MNKQDARLCTLEQALLSVGYPVSGLLSDSYKVRTDISNFEYGALRRTGLHGRVARLAHSLSGDDEAVDGRLEASPSLQEGDAVDCPTRLRHPTLWYYWVPCTR